MFTEGEFSPRMVLQIIPRLMNTMVVSVMSGNVHASLKALEGYCMFHRMLLAFVEIYPELLTIINKKAREFIKSPDRRTKDVIPSLGEFLPLITAATEVTWDDIVFPYLEEKFDRNVSDLKTLPTSVPLLLPLWILNCNCSHSFNSTKVATSRA